MANCLHFSLKTFPLNSAIKDECGLPFGCVVQPFAKSDRHPLDASELPKAANVARCDECFAYTNAYCQFSRYGWTCALCGAYNEYPAKSAYLKTTTRRALPELCSELVEFEWERVEVPAEDNAVLRPATVAVVDLSGGEEFLELVKSALLAALEALPPCSLFGIVTFSTKIGLYDIQGPVTVVKHLQLPSEDGEPLDLDEVMPLERLLAPLDRYKDEIAAAIETLQPISPWEYEAAQAVGGDVLQGVRAFGGTLDTLIDYLGARTEGGIRNGEEEEALEPCIGMCVFMAGPPDCGPGALDVTRFESDEAPGEGAEDELMEAQAAFYKEAGGRAAEAGIVIDLCVATPSYCDLATLKFLSTDTGGMLLLYQTLEDSTLPQDMYRRLRRPRAFHGLLRLRTSVEFSPVRAYGQFQQHEQFENLHHVLACDPHHTFAFDFEYTSTQGFSQPYPPILQLGFQYSVLIQDGASGKYYLQRRLRVQTVNIGKLAAKTREVYEGANPAVILSLLQHKITRATLEEGLAEGRLLLQDWLVILLAHYNAHFGLATFGDEPSMAALDVHFQKCEALQVLPRLVFALLRSPLLRSGDEAAHPDLRIYCQALYAALEPGALQQAVYPVLSSYNTVEDSAFPQHSLSRAALITCGSPIFLLDAFTSIVVYYAPNAPPDLPFPPPQACKLRAAINQKKGERVLTPRLHMIHGAHDSVAPFEALLLEEQDSRVPGSMPGLGYVGFLDAVKADVKNYMLSG